MKLSRPRTIGPYTLLAKIGEGGLSFVFLAVKEGKPFAVKCLKPEKGEDPQAVTDFIREIRIGSSLDHPNILKIVDHGKSGGVYFSVANLLLGEELHKVIQEWRAMKKRVPLPLSLYLIQECCRTLKYLHHKTVFEHSKSVLFHGDLSPDNILVLLDGSIRLIDFGSAGQEGAVDPKQRHFATLSYVPPELLQGERPTTQTDVYSLAVLSFYFLFNRRPFEGESKRIQLQMILSSPIPRLDAGGIAKSANDENALRIFFQKALHKDHAMRFQTIEEFEQDFLHLRFVEPSLTDPLEISKWLPPALLERVRRRDAEWTRIVEAFQAAGSGAAPPAKPVEPLLSPSARRRHPRISITDGAVRVEVVDSRERIMVSAEIHELSSGGMLVRWRGREPNRGQEYAIILHLGAGESMIQGTAKVLYEVKIQARSYVGMMFTKILPADYRTLETYVYDHLPKEPTFQPKAKPKPKIDRAILDVHFKNEKELREEYERNISHGGLFVEGFPQVHQGEKVEIRIHLPNSFRRVALKGEVVFITPDSESKQGMAIQLEGDPKTLEETLFPKSTDRG
jgi:serine/threonine protein kinase/Tfp pilus assembly protein PilZ